MTGQRYTYVASGGPRRPKRHLGDATERPDQRQWAEIWFRKLAQFHNVTHPAHWQFTREQVIEFLRSHKARGAPTWKRLKIVESLAFYGRTVRKSDAPELDDVRDVLLDRVRREQAVGDDGAPIEEAVGIIDPSEPEAIQGLRKALRVHQRALSTERAYVGRLREFMTRYGLDSLASFERITAREVESHLTHLAVDGNVAESTQDQAFYAILFLFEHVLKRDLKEVNAIRSTKPKRLPVVMSRAEVARVLDGFSGVYLVIAQILYGCGLRLGECLALRVKDIDFDQMQIVVRQAKGKKDRVVPLPRQLVEPLRRRLRSRSILHQKDLEEGTASVWLPHALGRKYPNAAKQFKWQYLFASDRRSRDPRTGKLHRHHLHEDTFSGHLSRAVEAARVDKKIGSHAFRHSFATHLLLDGADIRTVQELLGHADVKTTMVYLHVLNRLDITVTSPLDRLSQQQHTRSTAATIDEGTSLIQGSEMARDDRSEMQKRRDERQATTAEHEGVIDESTGFTESAGPLLRCEGELGRRLARGQQPTKKPLPPLAKPTRGARISVWRKSLAPLTALLRRRASVSPHSPPHARDSPPHARDSPPHARDFPPHARAG